MKDIARSIVFSRDTLGILADQLKNSDEERREQKVSTQQRFLSKVMISQIRTTPSKMCAKQDRTDIALQLQQSHEKLENS